MLLSSHCFYTYPSLRINHNLQPKNLNRLNINSKNNICNCQSEKVNLEHIINLCHGFEVVSARFKEKIGREMEIESFEFEYLFKNKIKKTYNFIYSFIKETELII